MNISTGSYTKGSTIQLTIGPRVITEKPSIIYEDADFVNIQT